jgi:hypothetical protein
VDIDFSRILLGGMLFWCFSVENLRIPSQSVLKGSWDLQLKRTKKAFRPTKSAKNGCPPTGFLVYIICTTILCITYFAETAFGVRRVFAENFISGDSSLKSMTC